MYAILDILVTEPNRWPVKTTIQEGDEKISIPAHRAAKLETHAQQVFNEIEKKLSKLGGDIVVNGRGTIVQDNGTRATKPIGTLSLNEHGLAAFHVLMSHRSLELGMEDYHERIGAED